MATNPYSGQRSQAQRNYDHIKRELATAGDFSKPIKQRRLVDAKFTLDRLKLEEKDWDRKHK